MDALHIYTIDYNNKSIIFTDKAIARQFIERYITCNATYLYLSSEEITNNKEDPCYKTGELNNKVYTELWNRS